MNRRVKLTLLGLTAGLVGALLPVVASFVVTALFQPAPDVLSSFWENKFRLLPIAAGFGSQVGIYAVLRKGLHIPFLSRTGGTAMGTGGGASTLAMIACCAPTGINLLLPLLGLTGITAMLANSTMPFMVISIGANTIGIGLMLYVLVKQRRLRQHTQSSTQESSLP